MDGGPPRLNLVPQHFTRDDLVFQLWSANVQEDDTYEDLSRFGSPPTWFRM